LSWNSSKYYITCVGFVEASLIQETSLAHAELSLVIAAIFRRFSFELYETDVSDVTLAHDVFLRSPKLDSKGVRVKVTGMNE